MQATRTVRARHLRVVTYNILLGGERRHDLIRRVLGRLNADVIALQEVCDLDMLAALARRLRMQALVGEPSDPGSNFHVAILTRLPVRSWRNRRHHGRMLRSHLHCEVETGGTSLPVVGVHCVHLAARFGERNKGEARRIRELGAVLGDVAQLPSLPHMLIGDFNALAPGDMVNATAFFRRMNELRRAGLLVPRGDDTVGPRVNGGAGRDELDDAWRQAGIDPRLEGGIPLLPRVVAPLTASLPLSRSVDRFLGRLIERWTVERLLGAGYADCFRRVHPRARGLTCATWLPAARVDYVFANPELAERVVECEVVGGRRWPDAEASTASDHFPIVADFAV